MKIPHLIRSGSFRPQIRDKVESLNGSDVIEIQLQPEGGYSGVIEIEIQDPQESHLEAAVNLTDASRFPARIRAACTELRDQGFIGKFRISHDDGLLTIQRI
jgi:hypothetical protein